MSYSFAPSGTGTTNPEDVFIFGVENKSCPIDDCTTEHCNHSILMWSGAEYSKDHTWIACKADDLHNLDEHR